MQSTFAIVGPLVSMTIAVLLFFGFLFGCYRFFRWLWSRLPNTVVSVPTEQIHNTLGLLIGATVSRVVLARDEDLKAGLTLDGLLSVVAGGMTAAVVVFLAAYGGLAVLGNSAGDPNPYAVFVTCLIGAVYSEDGA